MCIRVSLSATAWNDLQGTLREQQVSVGLPRFTLDYDIKLNNILKTMGMSQAFTDAAQLGKINPTADLLVSFVKQNTYLAVAYTHLDVYKRQPAGHPVGRSKRWC